MEFKFAHGWWLPMEDTHFDEYFSKSIEINGKNTSSVAKIKVKLNEINETK